MLSVDKRINTLIQLQLLQKRIELSTFAVKGQHAVLLLRLPNDLCLEATSSSVLKICRVDKAFGSVLGNDEIFLLCDKVQKGNTVPTMTV